jgi:PadR family transcriptional regulator, regulatory protein PadR
MIGDFEYLILAAATRLGDNAYGASIRTTIESTAERSCSPGALYTTLDRLEEKELIR